MVMPAWYDKLVEAKMHKVTQLSEEETAKEIADITGNAFNSEPSLYNPSPDGTIVLPRASMAPIPSIEQPKKKRGRPLGSRNKPKPGTP